MMAVPPQGLVRSLLARSQFTRATGVRDSFRGQSPPTMFPPMTTAALLLVLASAICHSGWNFLLKRSDHKVSFMASSAGVGALIFLVPAIAVTVDEGIGGLGLGM